MKVTTGIANAGARLQRHESMRLLVAVKSIAFDEWGFAGGLMVHETILSETYVDVKGVTCYVVHHFPE